MCAVRTCCWEALDETDPVVGAAERLYDRTQRPDERIPWEWIARSIRNRTRWRPGEWAKHLLVAAPAPDRPPAGTAGADWNPEPACAGVAADLAGFAYCVHLPGFGGYVCYVGVDEGHRKRGVGGRLFDQAFKVLTADAGAADEPLPFVVWESHRPGADAPAADWTLWDARVRLFDRVGGLWVEGLDLMTPNYGDPAGPPVPLQLFVRPVDRPATEFAPADLSALAAGMLERVYRTRPGDPLYDATLTPGRHPRLRPAREAGRRPLPAAA